MIQCQSSGAEIDFCHRQGDSVDIRWAVPCHWYQVWSTLAPKLWKKLWTCLGGCTSKHLCSGGLRLPNEAAFYINYLKQKAAFLALNCFKDAVASKHMQVVSTSSCCRITPQQRNTSTWGRWTNQRLWKMDMVNPHLRKGHLPAPEADERTPVMKRKALQRAKQSLLLAQGSTFLPLSRWSKWNCLEVESTICLKAKEVSTSVCRCATSSSEPYSDCRTIHSQQTVSWLNPPPPIPCLSSTIEDPH